MSNPRWHKILADLKMSRSRTILVILSIAIGVFAVGTILTARVVLQGAIEDSFDAANPASAVLTTEKFDEQLVDQVRALPDIAEVEGRTELAARLQGGGENWSNLGLYAIADFDDIRIDRVLPESGAWPPAAGELLLERRSAREAGLAVGDQVVIETADGVRHTVRVVGIAYDPGEVDPGIGNGRLTGYMAEDTLAVLGQPAGFNELHVLAAEDPRELRQGEYIAGLVRDEVLEPSGVTVQRIAVHDNPRYHTADLGDALILVLGILGGLILLLGVFLVINTINALLAQQVRQIGVMKAIGGRRGQIATIYLALVLGYGLIAVIVAVPLSALAARAFASYFGDMLNIEIEGSWFPSSVIAAQLGLGLLIPLLAALIPVLRGTGITVREALTSYGLSDPTSKPDSLKPRFARVRGVSRPVLLSLRNTFRRRSRLALTLATLTLGGAIFASVTTIQASLAETFDGVMRYSKYDVAVAFEQPEPVAVAIAEAEDVPGVVHAEGWITTNASRVRPDGTQNSNIWMMAAPQSTALIEPTLVEGRWFQPGEHEALVVNVDFRGDEADVRVGDTVTLKVEGHEVRWPVIGVVTTQMMGPVAYAPYEALSETLGMSGEANRVMLVTEQHDAATQAQVAQLAEQQLRAGGLPVVQVDIESEVREGTQSLFDILVVLLLIVGVLLVAVGSLGLMGAMSLNVIERTREIGVMRAIGASNGAVARIVIAEGLTVGLLGWLLGALLAIPLSWAMSYAIGTALVQVPLTYAFSALGILMWLALVIVLSIISSILPARNAWRLSVREVLAYE